MGVMDLIRRKTELREAFPPLSLEDWLSMFSSFNSSYVNSTYRDGYEKMDQNFCGMVAGGYEASSIVFAVEQTRVRHFTEATFKYRAFNKGRPGNLFGDKSLRILEQPWPGGTTGDLLAMMMLHADFAGAAFVRRGNNQLNVLRPDWMTMVIGSRGWPDAPQFAPDAELLGYLYQPGGPASGYDPVRYGAEEIAQFVPTRDPESQFRGMSWLRPVVSDVLGDRAASEHKLQFFRNGATPNMIVNVDISGSREEFKAWVDLFREGYEGNLNAYKTLFLQKAVDTKVVGSDFQQMDFKATTGVSETRIAAAGRVPPVIVGLSEGLQGSALNAGNYNSARRNFADGEMRPLWRNVAGSLAQLVVPPAGAQLWYDDRDIQFLKDDQKDSAEVQKLRAEAIRTLTDAGFEADSARDAVINDDFSLLKHSGLFSVQLMPPGEAVPGPGGAAMPGDVMPKKNGTPAVPA